MAVFLRSSGLIVLAAGVAWQAATVGGAQLSVWVALLSVLLVAFSASAGEVDDVSTWKWFTLGLLGILLLAAKDLLPASPVSGAELRVAAMGPEASWQQSARNPTLALAAAHGAALLGGLALVVALRCYAAGSAQRLVGALTLLAIALAGLGLAVALVVGATRDYGGSTYVGLIRNKNGAATLVMLGLLLNGLLADVARRDNRPLWVLGHGLVAMALLWPLVQLKSWTALVGLAFGLAVYGVHWVRGRELRWRPLLVLAGTGMLAAVAVATLEPKLANRMAEMTTDYRFEVWRDTLPMLRAHPWFGVGLGAFESVYPLEARMDLPLEVRLVHPDSSWVKLVLEWGLLPSSALLGGLGFGLMRATSQLRLSSEHDGLKAAGAVAVAAGCAWLASGCTDVTLHRPESFLVGIVCMGLAWAVWAPAEARGAGWRGFAVLIPVLSLSVGLAFWSERAAQTVRWNLLSPELLWQQAESERAAGGSVARQVDFYRAAVRLQHRSMLYPLTAARLLHGQDREAALFFWQEAFRRAQGMAWDQFGAMLRTLPPTPNEYWSRVAAGSDPDLLLSLSDNQSGTPGQYLVDWLRAVVGRRVSARSSARFLAAVERDRAWPLLTRAVALLQVEDRQFFIRAMNLLRGAGDLRGAWDAAVRILPVDAEGPSEQVTSLGRLAPEALVEVRAYEDLRRWILRAGGLESDRVFKILGRVCGTSSVPAWFHFRLARELAARGEMAAALDQVRVALAAGQTTTDAR